MTARSPGAWTHEPPVRAGVSGAAALRHTLLWASRRDSIKALVTHAPVTRDLVRRFVAGEEVEDAVRTARELADAGLMSSLDHLGEYTHDARSATTAVDVYRRLLMRLHEEGLAPCTEVSVKLTAVGQSIDERMAFENAHAICEAAKDAGIGVTIDMEDHTTTDSTLRVVRALRRDFTATGAVLQAALRRTPDDCAALAVPGSRIRLCKGAYQPPPGVAWQSPAEVRHGFLQCLRVLITGGAYVMSATHDPKLITATDSLLSALAEDPPHEHQMLYGVRPDEQRRLVDAGERVRVYTPFGTQWYSYLMRRLAERPANLALILRASVSGA